MQTKYQSQIMKIDFQKQGGLVPAIVQDAETKTVLMLGYMNEEAYKKTVETKKVTFYSRSKKRLWTKGEISRNFLELIDIKIDCDNDTLLVFAKPLGPVCHTGNETCWNENNESGFGFLSTLESVIKDRKDNPNKKSYTSSLFEKGISKIAQKVGEEAIEVVIEAKDENAELFINESADLLFHFLVLLQAKGVNFKNVVDCLKERRSF
ncbi:MAG: bifunctional phosphoribosyl-AMP cyclohydrolase/phosphoribosyl-ATP diphosphatase HisIE [Bacteroidetes bacterium]|nr:bifunctional phosphoribosyl-AMP cyclohydrolase/phosphoribosyl-ATP diphosphatase HisIE [Bacteroidota bacterium]